MPKNLIELIKASNNAGSSGQSFKNHVTGASGGGVSMTSYLVGTVGSVSGTPALPGETAPYASGSTFSFGVTWSDYGNNFSQIRRNGTTPWTHIGTATISIDSVSWSSNVSTVGLTVIGDYDTNTLQTLSYFNIWFVGYTNPNTPSSSAGETVAITAVPTGSTTPSGYDDRTIHLQYDPDIANYNPLTQLSSYSIRVNRRAYESWSTSHEWEVHNNSSYTGLLGTDSYSFTSYTNDVIDFYIRYRVRAAYNGGTPGSWTNHGLVNWTDPRADE